MRSTVSRLYLLAAIGAVVVAAALVRDHARAGDPHAASYRAASDAFEAGQWQRAHRLFSGIVAIDASRLAARRGVTNTLVQLGRLDDALEEINGVIAAEPDNACNFATRGIIRDRQNHHEAAMQDYAVAVRGCHAASAGMSWWQRLVTNTHERPPTIAARLAYLRIQMQLPPEDRVLRVPAKDRKQRVWISTT